MRQAEQVQVGPVVRLIANLAAAEECLRRRVMRMKFPAVSGPAKTVKFPFYYSK